MDRSIGISEEPSRVLKHIFKRVQGGGRFIVTNRYANDDAVVAQESDGRGMFLLRGNALQIFGRLVCHDRVVN